MLFCDPKDFNAPKLFEVHLDHLNEDFQHKQEQLKRTADLSDNDFKIIRSKTLADIERYLIPYSKTLLDFSIERPDYSLIEEDFQQSDLIQEELNYNANELRNTLNKENLLNADQKMIYDTIIQAEIDQTNQTVFFVDGPGGYGKTFLFNMILASPMKNTCLVFV